MKNFFFKVNKLGGFLLVRCKPQINKGFCILSQRVIGKRTPKAFSYLTTIGVKLNADE